ncbi:MAG: hypothetical protein K0R62_3276 [Nonomuraea muscovyensis]|nr:hypothetical protein [Nonomuraea muscovyensis]
MAVSISRCHACDQAHHSRGSNPRAGGASGVWFEASRTRVDVSITGGGPRRDHAGTSTKGRIEGTSEPTGKSRSLCRATSRRPPGPGAALPVRLRRPPDRARQPQRTHPGRRGRARPHHRRRGPSTARPAPPGPAGRWGGRRVTRSPAAPAAPSSSPARQWPRPFSATARSPHGSPSPEPTTSASSPPPPPSSRWSTPPHQPAGPGMDTVPSCRRTGHRTDRPPRRHAPVRRRPARAQVRHRCHAQRHRPRRPWPRHDPHLRP